MVRTFKRDYVRINPLPDALTVLRQLRRWFADYNDTHPQRARHALPQRVHPSSLIHRHVSGLTGQHQPERTLQKAMEVAKAGLDADGNEPWAHYGLGSAYIYQKQYDLGIRSFKKAHELNPNEATILADYAWALSRAGRPDEALPLIQEALSLNPYHPRFYVADVLRRVHFVAGRYQAALDALLSVSDPYPPLYQRLAATYPYLDRIEEARAAMAKFRELEPQASIELYARTEPFQRPEDLERFLDGLRKAGLPETPPAPGT